jgi:glutamate/aspartate transport system substrate-binding protein
MKFLNRSFRHACLMLFGLLVWPAFPLAADIAITDDLKDLAARGEIIIGVRESAVPFSYINKDGSAAGYSIVICNRVVDNLRRILNKPDLRVSYNNTIAVTRALLVREGVIDLECGATSHTLAREKSFDFSLSFGIEKVRLVSLANANYKDLAALAGKRLLVTQGSTTQEMLQSEKAAGRLAAEIVPVRTAARAYYALKEKKGDAYMGNAEMFRGELLIHGGRNAEFASNPVESPAEPLAVMLRKGRPGLKAVIDETIAGMANSGELRALYRTWFEQPIAGRGVNLESPPTPEWQAVLATPTDRAAD